MEKRAQFWYAILFCLYFLPTVIFGQPVPGDTNLGAGSNVVVSGGGADLVFGIDGWVFLGIIYLAYCYLPLEILTSKKVIGILS
jgi:hypothetical protein